MSRLELSPPYNEMLDGIESLRRNKYPGRVLIMGRNTLGNLGIQAYALMGRSAPSKDRIFVQEGSAVRTKAPHKTPEEMAATPMAALIYYRALKSEKGVHVVSNGAQTDPVLDSLVAGDNLRSAITSAPTVDGVDLSAYEPDKPNNTPRITGVIDLREDAKTPFGLAVVRKHPDDDRSMHAVYDASSIEDLEPGVGYCVQTYAGNGNPLPSFNKAPYPVTLGMDVMDTAHTLWGALDKDTRVSLVVRAIDLSTKQAVGTCIMNGEA